MLHNAEMTPDGQVDTARNSQLYNALVKIIDTLVSKVGVRYDKTQGLKDGEKLVARENINAADATATATELGKKLNSSEFTTACKNLITKWGGTVPS